MEARDLHLTIRSLYNRANKPPLRTLARQVQEVALKEGERDVTISPTGLSELLNGKRMPRQWNKVRIICAVLGATPSELAELRERWLAVRDTARRKPGDDQLAEDGPLVTGDRLRDKAVAQAYAGKFRLSELSFREAATQYSSDLVEYGPRVVATLWSMASVQMINWDWGSATTTCNDIANQPESLWSATDVPSDELHLTRGMLNLATGRFSEAEMAINHFVSSSTESDASLWNVAHRLRTIIWSQAANVIPPHACDFNLKFTASYVGEKSYAVAHYSSNPFSHNLATWNDWARCEAQLRLAYSSCRRLLGEFHPCTFSVRADLCRLLTLRCESREDAIEEGRALLAAFREWEGDNYSLTILSSWREVIGLLVEVGRSEVADNELVDFMKAATDLGEADSRQAMEVGMLIAETHQRRGDLAAAEAQLRGVIMSARRAAGASMRFEHSAQQQIADIMEQLRTVKDIPEQDKTA